MRGDRAPFASSESGRASLGQELRPAAYSRTERLVRSNSASSMMWFRATGIAAERRWVHVQPRSPPSKCSSSATVTKQRSVSQIAPDAILTYEASIRRF